MADLLNMALEAIEIEVKRLPDFNPEHNCSAKKELLVVDSRTRCKVLQDFESRL